MTSDLASKAAKAAELGGSAAASVPVAQRYVFGLPPDEWTIVFGAVGAAVAVLGFVVSWVYQHRRTRAYIAHLNRVGPEDEA